MQESILTSIKLMIGGLDETHDQFDTDIITHINTTLFSLTQMGIGPSEGFSIKDATATWSDFLQGKQAKFEAVKSYVYLNVKLLFDSTSLSSGTIEAYNRKMSEYEVRLTMAADSSASGGSSVPDDDYIAKDEVKELVGDLDSVLDAILKKQDAVIGGVES